MEIKSLLITITLCLSFLVNSIMFGWEATRRPADDFAKIKVSTASQEENCIKGGGMPEYYGGDFIDCKKNN